jgi:hypothetical protein
MEIYSIGFTQKTAEQFFGILKRAGIRFVADAIPVRTAVLRYGDRPAHLYRCLPVPRGDSSGGQFHPGMALFADRANSRASPGMND